VSPVLLAKHVGRIPPSAPLWPRRRRAARTNVLPKSARASFLSTLSSLWRGRAGSVARVLIAVLPLLWLYKIVSVAELYAGMQQLGVMRLVFGFLIGLVPYAFNALRWRMLLGAASGTEDLPSVARLWRFNIEGVYFSLVPTGLAADVMRGYRAQAHVDAQTSYAIVVIERLLGLGALFVAAGLARLSAPRALPALFDAIVISGCAAALAALVIGPAVLRRVVRVPAMRARFGPLAERLLARKFWVALALGAVISLGGQMVSIVYVWVLALAWAPDAELHQYLQVVPFAFLATFIPITPGAMGQREAVFVWLFAFVGLAPAQAVLLALCIAGLGYVTVLLGAALYFADLRKSRATSP